MRTVEEIQADIDAAKAADSEADVTELTAELAAATKAAEGKGNDPGKTGKTFTQEEVNAIVKDRLAQRDAKHRRTIDALQADLDDAQAKVTDYDEIMKTFVAERVEKLEPAIKSLVLEKDPLEQWKWLAANPLPEFKGGPITPKPGDAAPVAGKDLRDKNIV